MRSSSFFVLLASACGPAVPFDDIGDSGDGHGSSGADYGTAPPFGTSEGGEGRPDDEGEADGADLDDGGDDDESGGASTCGDGMLDGDEACDDGNATPGDGCEADCTVTPGLELWSQVIGGDGDDSARDVVTDDTNLFVVGAQESAGNDDVWMRVLLADGSTVSEHLVDLGGDELGTSIARAGDMIVGAVNPDEDRALLLRYVGDELVPLDGASTEIATFTALVSPTAEGFVLVTNGGGFDDLVATVRRFDAFGTPLGEAMQPTGVYVGAAIPEPQGGTILGGGTFGGMGSGGAVWLAALASDANTQWESAGEPQPGFDLRLRALAIAPDGRIVGVGTRGQGGGGPMNDDDTGWIWWWSPAGAPESDGELDIGGAAARPNAVVVGTHGLVIGGTIVALEDGFVAGLAEDGTLQWGAEVAGDAGLEDRVASLALYPGVGVAAVGTVTSLDTGEDAWVGVFTE